MNKFIALCYFLLSLYGCDVGQSTSVHRIREDGRDTLHSQATTRAGVTRFECVRSASGQCHYAVFPHSCTSTPGIPVQRCASAPVRQFAIANGGARQVAGLSGFDLCVSDRRPAAGTDCPAPEPIAAR